MSKSTACAEPPAAWPRSDWGQCLFSGAAGVLLLHVERASRGRSTWATVEQWATVVCRDPLYAHPDTCGLFRGVPAVTFALHQSAVPDHQQALSHLDRQLVSIAHSRLEAAHARMSHGELPTLGEFDLIRGLTGLGVCALRRNLRALLTEVLEYLVALSMPVQVKGEPLPGWWTSNGPDDRPPPHPDGGHSNLGMAHGIAGPLALLATAARRGMVVAGQFDAIARICQVFDRFCGSLPLGYGWPGLLRLSEWRSGVLDPGHQPERPSWCYGLSGVARALQLAALATNDREQLKQIELAFAHALQDESLMARLDNPFLCHGWAGLLLSGRRIADSASHMDIHAALSGLEARLAASVQACPADATAGLLDGPAGLELLALETEEPTQPTSGWDSCLLVAQS